MVALAAKAAVDLAAKAVVAMAAKAAVAMAAVVATAVATAVAATLAVVVVALAAAPMAAAVVAVDLVPATGGTRRCCLSAPASDASGETMALFVPASIGPACIGLGLEHSAHWVAHSCLCLASTTVPVYTCPRFSRCP